jgi:hypothetical protein
VRNERKRSDAVTAEANARRLRRAFGEDARWLMAAVLGTESHDGWRCRPHRYTRPFSL